MYFTVAAIAAILMMSINLNANMNSNMNAYATILSDIQGADDIGQSVECVIVVVGCDGTGSVGSSGDTIIGSFNGNDDNNTSGGDTPLPPIANCEECLANPQLITAAQLSALAVALGLEADATIAEICAELGAVATVEALVLLLGEAGLTAQAIVDLLACLEIEITLDEVVAILL